MTSDLAASVFASCRASVALHIVSNIFAFVHCFPRELTHCSHFVLLVVVWATGEVFCVFITPEPVVQAVNVGEDNRIPGMTSILTTSMYGV